MSRFWAHSALATQGCTPMEEGRLLCGYRIQFTKHIEVNLEYRNMEVKGWTGFSAQVSLRKRSGLS